MSIASEISRLQGAKADLKTAIEGKGVTVPSATKLDGYADLVDAISQGGGSTLVTKNISANGTYNASSDSADGYSQVNVSVPASAVDSGTKSITANGNNQDVVGYAAVNVNVPNTYSAGDEGKVVSNGALVSQTSDTVTANDTYDTTLINSLTVNVSGGGGSSPFELLNTITIPQNVRGVNIDFTDYSDYDLLILYQEVTLSANDWLYYSIDESSPTGGSYGADAVTHNGVSVLRGKNIPSYSNRAWYSKVGAGNMNGTVGSISNIYIYTYSASKSIVAGSTFKIFGVKYANM